MSNSWSSFLDALSKGIEAGDSEAADAIRELIETITVFRDHSNPGGVTGRDYWPN